MEVRIAVNHYCERVLAVGRPTSEQATELPLQSPEGHLVLNSNRTQHNTHSFTAYHNTTTTDTHAQTSLTNVARMPIFTAQVLPGQALGFLGDFSSVSRGESKI